MKQDTAEARKRYRRLSDLGDNEARYRAAKLAAADADYKEALPLYERLARDDDWRALLDLGQMHEDGRGMPKNLARAAELYERAAERSAWARAKLGILYLESKDFPKARHWLSAQRSDGNGAARNNLGLMHERGLGGRSTTARRAISTSVRSRSATRKRWATWKTCSPPAAARRRGGGGGRVVPARRRGRPAVGAIPPRPHLREGRACRATTARRRAPAERRAAGHAEARKEAAELFYKLGMDRKPPRSATTAPRSASPPSWTARATRRARGAAPLPRPAAQLPAAAEIRRGHLARCRPRPGPRHHRPRRRRRDRAGRRARRGPVERLGHHPVVSGDRRQEEIGFA